MLKIWNFVHTSEILILPFLLHKLSVFVCVPCNGLMVADRYMVIAFKRERKYKGSAVIIENNLRGFSWQAMGCIMIAADAVPWWWWYQYPPLLNKCERIRTCSNINQFHFFANWIKLNSNLLIIKSLKLFISSY